MSIDITHMGSHGFEARIDGKIISPQSLATYVDNIICDYATLYTAVQKAKELGQLTDAPELAGLVGGPVETKTTGKRSEPTPAQAPERKLALRFLALPSYLQFGIAQSLNLLTDADRVLSDDDLILELFRRATQRGRLQKLWQEINKAHAARRGLFLV
jgi:hypothetical protein